MQHLAELRFERRTKVAAIKPSSLTPGLWSLDRHFDPFYVRARLKHIVEGITRSLRKRRFKPKAALVTQIPKANGGTRSIQTFTVPDSALAYWLTRELTKRNIPLFSSHAYAYRTDRSGQDAVLYLAAELQRHSRRYVLEIDFAKYFDSLSHEYLFRVLQDEMRVSPSERKLLEDFLRAPRAHSRADYSAGKFDVPIVGIPQGSSVSLFLANVACLELDRELERTGAVFARYADDVVIICDSYQRAHECAEVMLEHADRSGAAINLRKSSGISLFTDHATKQLAEIPTKDHVDFMGYAIRRDGICLAASTMARMKRQIGTLIYRSLLLYPKKFGIPGSRLAFGVDWDMVSFINSLRRYLYGRSLTENLIRAGIRGRIRHIPSGSVFSYFPCLTMPSSLPQLRGLDGWLVSVFARGIRARTKLLTEPRDTLTLEAIRTGTWKTVAVSSDTRLPSATLAGKYVARISRMMGVQKFPTPNSGDLPDDLIEFDELDSKEPA